MALATQTFVLTPSQFLVQPKRCVYYIRQPPKMAAINFSLTAWKKVFGEESNEFTNDLGEKVILRLCPTKEGTVELLSEVLEGNTWHLQRCASGGAFTDPTVDSTEVTLPGTCWEFEWIPWSQLISMYKVPLTLNPSRNLPHGLQCVTILIDLNTLRRKGPCYWAFLTWEPTSIHFISERNGVSPGQFGSVDRASACRLKGPGFDSEKRNGSEPRSQLAENTSSDAEFSPRF
ncbi:hypothetical protein QTO34_009558 [Cnephaeus nilssonii]|uniref:Uncharacterized protein n=1 Tax=Cnephaeus nilssonii TaxID=3371016 RepID=A0AA40HI35_CNENI|nr:hypothetical protein QTO34_009558 [Eptesicus nilssonii]